MSTITLSNQGYMGLGIYVGYQSFARRSEMAAVGVDYDQVTQELRQVGLIKGNKMDLKRGREVFNARFPGILPSQVHQYCNQLGFKLAYC